MKNIIIRCLYCIYVMMFKRKLLIPDIKLNSILDIDIKKLKKEKIEVLIFDKDNTLIIPYSEHMDEKYKNKIEQLKKKFDNQVYILSNDRGLKNEKYRNKLEKIFNIPILTLKEKKPLGGQDLIDKFTNKKIAFIGDQPSFDIVFANRNNILSILVEPININKDPFIEKYIWNKLENRVLKRLK